MPRQVIGVSVNFSKAVGRNGWPLVARVQQKFSDGSRETVTVDNFSEGVTYLREPDKDDN